MNEEIKEILDYLNEFINEDRLEQINLNRWFIISLLDYITNLQKENERLKRKLTTKKLFKKYKVQTPENFEIRKIFELQQRIEKVVEYINNGSYFDGSSMCKEDLLNILNGRSDE